MGRSAKFTREDFVRIKSVIKGVGSFVLPAWRSSTPGDTGAIDANGSYAIFVRYVRALAKAGIEFDGRSVMEFGPGASLGVGFCALLCGASRYHPIDLIDHTDPERNVLIFDQLAGMLKDRAPIPTNDSCGRIFPFLDDTDFARDLLPDDLLSRTLNPKRIAAIRNDISKQTRQFVRPSSSHNIANQAIDAAVDIILSESVMEHVDDLEGAYAFFARSISPDGCMVHLIDYGSHKLTSEWNGHWQASPLMWSLTRGKRYYLINRAPHQHHVDLMEQNGFSVLHTERLRRPDGLLRPEMSDQFQSMSLIDSQTHLASVFCVFTQPHSATSACCHWRPD